MKKKQFKITTVMALSVITMSATTPVLTAHADDVAEPATEEQAQEIINTLDLPEVAADAPTVEPETVEETAPVAEPETVEETAPVAETAVEEEPDVQVIEEAEDDTSFSANNIISPMAEEEDNAIGEEDIFFDPTNIIVEYVTEDGAPIAEPTTGLYYAGDTYSFTAPTIEHYDLVGTSSYSGEVTEAMAGESITITFTYVRAASAPELGSITVNINYVDYEGEPLAPSQTFQLEKGRRHAIDAVLDIENYIIDDNEPIDADGNYVVVIRDDEYTDNTLNLNILYHPEDGYSEDEDDDLITAPLYVNYVDTEGRNIAPSEVQDLPLFHSFRVEAITIPGYSLVSDNIFDGEMQNESGEVVNFVYERIESEGEQTEAQVIINYYDVNTMEQISETAYTMETIGTTVQYEAPFIEGYTILPEYASVSQTIFAEGGLFEFYYTKDSEDENRTAWLTINYMDTAGNVLSEPQHIEYAVGEFVNFEVDREFDGYSVIGANEATFEMPAEGYTHTFFYQDLSKPDVEEYGNLVISYRDLEGNDLLPSETQVVQVGTNVTITARNIEGYELQSPATQDIYMSSVLGQSAMFVYAKLAEELPDPVEPTEPEEEVTEGTVTVNFIDEDGKALASPQTHIVKVGEDYSYDARTIDGYRLTSASTIGGTMTADLALMGETINFTYEAIDEVVDPTEPEDQTADVVINLLDPNGNVIASVMHREVTVGESFRFVAPEIEGYEIIGDGIIEGVALDSNTLTYSFAYRLIEETPAPSEPGEDESDGEEEATHAEVAISYTDMDGKILHEGFTRKVKIGDEFEFKAIEIDGYEVVGPDTFSGMIMDDTRLNFSFMYQEVEEIPAPTPVDPDDSDEVTPPSDDNEDTDTDDSDDSDEVTPPSDDNDDSNDETTPSDDNDDADNSDNTSGGTNRPIFNDTNEDESEATNNSSSDKIKTENTSRGDSNNKSDAATELESTTDANDESLPQANESAKTSILVSTLGAMMLATLAFVSRKRFSTKK